MPKDFSSKKAGGVVDLRSSVSNLKPPAKSLAGSSGGLRPGADRLSVKRQFTKTVRPQNYSFASRHRPANRPKVLFFFIVLLIILIGAAVAGFLFFGQKFNSARSLRLTLAAPQAIIAGEEATLTIGYENLDKVPLENLEAVLEYPEGFFYGSSSQLPYNRENNLWRLENLAVGQKAELTISGRLIGLLDESKEFNVIFQYQPRNFNSNFKETISQRIKISDALLAINLTAPETVTEGQTVEFKVAYQNKRAQAFTNLRFAFELGEAFKILGATPTSTNNQWVKDKLEKDESGEISLSGQLDPLSAAPLSWYFKAWWLEDNNGQQLERPLFQQSGKISLVKPDLTVAVEVLSSADKFNWGQTVDYKITYQNNGQLEAKDAVLKLALNELIDWPKYQNKDGAKIENNSLSWNGSAGAATAALASLGPQAKGELIVSLPLIGEPKDLAQKLAEDLTIEAVASLSVKVNGLEKVFSSSPQLTAIVSQPRLVTEARYYLDTTTKVGSGPLPPKIGEETKYRIFWKLFTGSQGLNRIKVKTNLPAYIKWLGSVDQPTLGSPLQFDESAHELVWEADEAAPNSSLLASFLVAVEPKADQVNQLLILTNPSSLSAQEKNTQNLVSKTAGLLTSDLIGDPVAQGQGRVTVK